eukprot:1495240-Rhodomonas_salina.1
MGPEELRFWKPPSVNAKALLSVKEPEPGAPVTGVSSKATESASESSGKNAIPLIPSEAGGERMSGSWPAARKRSCRGKRMTTCPCSGK